MNIKKCTTKDIYDFGILGLWHGKNYGAVYTSYALYQTMQNLGYRVALLDIGENIDDTENVFRSFINLEQVITHKVDIKHPYMLNKYFKGYLVGSDMLWCYNIESYFFFLDFATAKKRKVSYSTSMNSYQKKPLSYRLIISMLLKRFNAFSFREKQLMQYFKEQYRAEGPCMIDPVFLLSADKWKEIANKAEVKSPVPYTGAYILDPTLEKKQLLDSLSSKLNTPLSIVIDAEASSKSAASRYGYEKAESEVCLYQFLSHILHSDFFVTDSFHGMCFALIFNKPCLIIKNTRRGSQRFESLARILECEHLLVSENYDVNHMEIPTKINWVTINNNIANEVTKSLSWLKAAVKSPLQPKRLFFAECLVHRPTLFYKLIKNIIYFTIRIEYKLMRIFKTYVL